MKQRTFGLGLTAAAAVTCLPTAAWAQACVDGGRGTFLNANGDAITIDGGQVSIAGATLFVDFFATPSSSNDWNDVDNDGFSGFDPFTFPFVDQLGTTYVQGDPLNTWWALQYRSVGSVRGFNEFVESQTCNTIPIDVPSEKGVFNGVEYAVTGVITFSGVPDNTSGTPLTPCAINASFLDVPSSWAVQVPGAPNWNRTPTAPGYGLSPIPSSTGALSELETLGRTCGTCSVSGDPCTADRYCPAGETCVTGGPEVLLNSNTGSPDANTLFDYVGAWVPVALIANRGTGIENIKFSEAQYLFVTGRMPNGENLQGATRDVGSGTRNAAMNSLGIDTSWGRGDNVGNRVDTSAQTNLGPNTQPDNCGGSSIMENSVEQRRLAIGYTGLAGGSRAAQDAQSGRYELLNTCKDVPATGQAACDCSVSGYVRPGVDTVLDNCDACASFQIAGSGSFVSRGNRNANRDPFDPLYELSQPIADTAVADYLNNIFDSIASFDGSTEPGECQVSRVCGAHLTTACLVDADCPDFATGETCILKPCSQDSQCPLSNTATCVGGVNDGAGCTGNPGLCTGGECRTTEFCKLKFNMPGELLATEFFLPNGLDCLHNLNEPLRYQPVAVNQSLQDFIRSNSIIAVPSYGSVNPANRVPKRNTRAGGADVYSDGSTGSYRYWNGSSFVSLGAGVNLASRNRTQGDLGGDCVRDINDAAELVKAYYAPRSWQQTAVATGNACGTNTGAQTTNNAIPEVIGDFDGDGSLTREDLRYFADGLAMVSGGAGKVLDRKQGAIAIDNAIVAQGRPYPWADTTGALLVPPAVPGTDPTFNTPHDVNDAGTPFLKTHKVYQPGDFRGDIAGANPTAGAWPMGWDGVIDDKDVDYVFDNIGDWTNLDSAALIDLSADMDGNLVIDVQDAHELVETILGTAFGDADLDGSVNCADACVVCTNCGAACSTECATLLASCPACPAADVAAPVAFPDWKDGDFTGDDIVDGQDLAFLTLCPLSAAPVGEDILNAAGATVQSVKNRFVSFRVTTPGQTAVRVTFVSLPGDFSVFNGTSLWVDLPFVASELPGKGLTDAPGAEATFMAAALRATPAYADWSSFGVVNVYDERIVPSRKLPASPVEPAVYSVQVIAQACAPGSAFFSESLSTTNARWGDVAALTSGQFRAPDGVVGVTDDVLGVLAKFGNAMGAPTKARAELVGSGPTGPVPALTGKIEISDVLAALGAFSGNSYPFAPPAGGTSVVSGN